jgi:sulfur relay (sulfurtransferase) DsrC/TusE family protein
MGKGARSVAPMAKGARSLAESIAARLSHGLTHAFWRKLHFVRTLLAFLTFSLAIFLTIKDIVCGVM